jgi:glycosyltransferase involved in cell wall biosynthesis
MLLAPLPNDAQSAYRFPTKIGEYLASGRPVLTTPVGEVTAFLQDGISAFLATSTDPGALAERMMQLAGDPAVAARVGAAGRALALARFHYAQHGSRLGAFLNSLCSRNCRTRG